jgi:cyclomaltodextrinase / maltogenic alpha-amylase / neopullulanase
MPLVYSGQEAGLDRSLKFFDKDPIEWKEHPFANMYKKLFALKHTNQALWNGSDGGEMIRIFNDRQDQVISFSRTKNKDRVIPIINYSDKPATVTLHSKYQKGRYRELFSGKDYELKGEDVIKLDAWDYLVLVK